MYDFDTVYLVLVAAIQSRDLECLQRGRRWCLEAFIQDAPHEMEWRGFYNRFDGAALALCTWPEVQDKAQDKAPMMSHAPMWVRHPTDGSLIDSGVP